MSGHLASGLAPHVAMTAPRKRVRIGYSAIVGDLLLAWDTFSIAGSGLACSALWKIYPSSSVGVSMSLVAGLLAPLVLRPAKRDAMNAARNRSIVEAVRFIVYRLSLLFAILFAIFFLLHTGASIPRSWMASWFGASLACTLGARMFLLGQLRSLEANGSLRDRIAVIGSGEAAARTIAELKRQRGKSVEIVGIFDDKINCEQQDDRSGDIERLVDLGRQHALDGVVLAIGTLSKGRLPLIMHELKKLDVTVALCPLMLGLEAPKLGFGYLAGLPFVVIADRPISHGGLVVKAGLDKLLALGLLLLSWPLLAIIALAIKATSPGPIFFCQRRVGRNNAEFEIFKFRTMYIERQDPTGGRQTLRNDDRVTAIGRILRTTSLDELPQLFNVMNGTMSLVGPRPLTRMMRTEDRFNTDIVAEYEHRHRVKPGITGLAQVNGHRGATDKAEQVKERIKYDLNYIDNWSLSLDLWIIFITPFKLLFSRANAF